MKEFFVLIPLGIASGLAHSLTTTKVSQSAPEQIYGKLILMQYSLFKEVFMEFQLHWHL